MNLKDLTIIGGRFRLLQMIGKGGFGETYLAEDIQGKNKKCLVKCFSFHSESPKLLAKAKSLFQRESDVLFRLTENNYDHSLRIPNFIAYLEENNQYYLIQELIEGKTLRQELNLKGKFSELEIINVLKDVLEILIIIHNFNIIHRDIKPDNLMRKAEDNLIFLIDFGSVKEQLTQLTQIGTNIQTIGYAPLEQYQGNPQKNSDIFALGITALELLTGVSPSEFYNNLDSFIDSDQLKISQPLSKILSKMVASDYKSDRYQSVKKVLEDLHYLTSNSSEIMKTQILSNTFSSSPESKNNRPLFTSLIIVTLSGLSLVIIGISLLLFRLTNNPASNDLKNTSVTQPNNHPSIRFNKVESQNLKTNSSNSSPNEKIEESNPETTIRFKKVNPD